ncbi:hypothetical protein LA345_13175 [Burkholderia vietnamiensis]|uniref:DNA methylase adenine-specific domain-containing protein n=1 Tax=Burkholderia vietnamiensis (strain G4 / LMG 22486) TaxID=269482 RepID=A4JFQ2_BURVG|nr:hypothetical protein Bcep1808_2103 [Burkholderia vietnamiensis G4]MCB4344865.1 hypothetical protein [Burkholderia vietnamiensis]
MHSQNSTDSTRRALHGNTANVSASNRANAPMAHELFGRITDFACRNPLADTPKAVLDDIVQLHFNLLSEIAPVVCMNGWAWFHPDHLVELDRYKGHDLAWQELVALSQDFTTVLGTSEPFVDLVGAFYNEAIAPKRAIALGQFLTPPSLARAVDAFVSEPSAASAPEPGDPSHFADLCCGAGALALAHLSGVLGREGKTALAPMHVLIADVDPAMAKLAAVQVAFSALFHQAPLCRLRVQCGDLIADYIKSERQTLMLDLVFDRDRLFGGPVASLAQIAGTR